MSWGVLNLTPESGPGAVRGAPVPGQAGQNRSKEGVNPGEGLQANRGRAALTGRARLSALDRVAKLACTTAPSQLAMANSSRVPEGAPIWVPPGHFYSPIPDLASVRERADRIFHPGGLELPGVNLRLAEQYLSLIHI